MVCVYGMYGKYGKYGMFVSLDLYDFLNVTIRNTCRVVVLIQ